MDKALGNSQVDVDQRSLIYKGMLEGLEQRGSKNNAQVFAKWAPQLATELLKKYPAKDTTDSDTKYNNQTTAIAIAGDYKVKSLEGDLKAFIDEGHRLGMNLRSNVLRSLMKIDLEKYAKVGGDILRNDTLIDYEAKDRWGDGRIPRQDCQQHS